MIDIKLSPPREGTRGGREQFKWEDLKSHDLKDREHYLGHSVKVGLLERKNKFYKHDWYLKRESESTEKDVDEVELTRRYEEEVMQEMLGVKPKRLMLLKSKPTDPRQLRELLGSPKKELSLVKKSHSKLPSNSYSRSRSRSRNSYSRRHRSRSRSRSLSSSEDSDRRYRRRHRDSTRHSRSERDLKKDDKYERNHDRHRKPRSRSRRPRDRSDSSRYRHSHHKSTRHRESDYKRHRNRS